MKKRMAELKYQEEIARLNNTFSDTQQLLREENKTRVKLKSDAVQKMNDITTMEEAIAFEEKVHRQNKQDYRNETKLLEAEKRERLSELHFKENILKNELAAFDLVERENAQLQAKLSATLVEYQKTSAIRGELREDRKQQNFDVRMMMDETLRKIITELNADYQQKASRKLEDDASKAKQENQALSAEIQVLEDKSGQLISEQHQSYDQLRRLHIEQEVIGVTADIQEQKVIQLTQLKTNQLKYTEELATFIRQVKSEISHLKALYKKKMNKTDQLKSLQNEYKNIIEKRIKKQEAVIKFTQQLVLDTLDLSEIERQERSARIVSGLVKPNRQRELFARSLTRSFRPSALSGVIERMPSQQTLTISEKSSVSSVCDVTSSQERLSSDDMDYERVWKSDLNKV